MSFGQRLRGLRRDFDLSQADLGTSAGCSVNTIRKLESDERKPSRELAARLAGVFELSPRDRTDFMRLARGVHLGGRASLPASLTRLIGRESEIRAVRDRLEDARLLTLIGPPGVGKTRLALQVASEVQSLFRDGVAFVALADLHDAGQVMDGIARSIGARGAAARPINAAVRELLAHQHVLLVLDNFEHVMAARGELAPLLAAAPRLKVLVTSREPLRLYGEHLYEVPTLGLPRRDAPRRSASEDLFLERARAARPGFGTRQADDAVVADICVQLEGLPLAIELAASRARAVGPAAILGEVRSRLDALSDGPADFTSRQRSMRGALDWSYTLLSVPERQLFSQLTVFAGGASLEAIAAVCGCGSDVVYALADRSLLRLTEAAGRMRFSMLGVIRDYAAEQSELDAPARDAVRSKHAAYFAALAEQAPAGIRGPGQLEWLQCLELEHDNMRAALTWALGHAQADVAGRLAAGLWPFWRARGLYHEGRRWLESVLALGAALAPEVRADALNGAGVLALLQTDYAAAQTHLEAARTAFLALGDRAGEAFATSNLGWLARNRRDIGDAQRLFETSLRMRRDLGDRWGEAWTLNNLGVVALDRSDTAAARALLGESGEVFRAIGNTTGLLQALHNLGWALQEAHEYAEARTLFGESLMLARSLNDARGAANSLGDLALMNLYTGDYATAAEQFEDSLLAYARLGDQRNVAACIEGLAGVAAVTGRAVDAARRFGLAAAMRARLGAPLLESDRAPYDSMLATAREQLDDDAWRKAWSEGEASTPEQLLPELLA